eukprot:SAG11_NODE_4589_length_1841_cov_1.169346_2_plen_46_part_01
MNKARMRMMKTDLLVKCHDRRLARFEPHHKRRLAFRCLRKLRLKLL